MSLVWKPYSVLMCNVLRDPGLQGTLPTGTTSSQRRFAASPVNTCFGGVPFMGRGVEGCEEVRVMFSLWRVFIGNFVLHRFPVLGCDDEINEQVNLPACRTDRHRLAED